MINRVQMHCFRRKSKVILTRNNDKVKLNNDLINDIYEMQFRYLKIYTK